MNKQNIFFFSPGQSITHLPILPHVFTLLNFQLQQRGQLCLNKGPLPVTLGGLVAPITHGGYGPPKNRGDSEVPQKQGDRPEK